jgi:hypothetical protein
VNRIERRQRITEYDRQINNLEQSQAFLIDKLAESQWVVVFLTELADSYTLDIAGLKQQREMLLTGEGKIPGLAYTVTKRVNKPAKRQPRTRHANTAEKTKKSGGIKSRPRRDVHHNGILTP